MCYFWCPMPHPCLLFSPYLTLSPDEPPITFTDWELGPLESFNNRWADPQFKEQATAFLSKFVKPSNRSIDNPALLCRKGKPLDGQRPPLEELTALELSLIFALVDRNPRTRPENSHQGWGIVTADNAEELFIISSRSYRAFRFLEHEPGCSINHYMIRC